MGLSLLPTSQQRLHTLSHQVRCVLGCAALVTLVFDSNTPDELFSRKLKSAQMFGKRE